MQTGDELAKLGIRLPGDAGRIQRGHLLCGPAHGARPDADGCRLEPLANAEVERRPGQSRFGLDVTAPEKRGGVWS